MNVPCASKSIRTYTILTPFRNVSRRAASLVRLPDNDIVGKGACSL